LLLKFNVNLLLKFLDPIVRRYFDLDIYVQTTMFKLAAVFFPGYDFVWLCERMEFLLKGELDFKKEAENGLRAKKNLSHRYCFLFTFRNDTFVPTPIEKFSSERVLST
jgi:predicted unusual protein kinase regulating ubiquinone biosynthesis (AarF/ABC1/UbiB family)